MMKKTFLSLVAFFVLAVVFVVGKYFFAQTDSDELTKELLDYQKYSSKLEEGTKKLTVGVSRGEVEKIMLVPPDHFFFNESAGTVTWHWNASEHVGYLRKKTIPETEKGHYGVSVIFASDGKVEKVYSGIN